MEGHSKSSHKYLLLQVWCGLLTVAIVVMAAVLTSIKLKATEDDDVVTTVKPDVHPTVKMAHLQSDGSSLSYIQLMMSLNSHSWEESPGCTSCSLALQNNSIYCLRDSLYFIYAQVTFTKLHGQNQTKSVDLTRNATFGRRKRTLVEGTLGTTEGTLWVAKIVPLKKGDSVTLNVSDDFLIDKTFWGALQLP